MGMLLRFSPKPSRTIPAAPVRGTRGAEVVLFTGVRYDREHGAGQSKKARQKPRTRKG